MFLNISSTLTHWPLLSRNLWYCLVGQKKEWKLLWRIMDLDLFLIHYHHTGLLNMELSIHFPGPRRPAAISYVKWEVVEPGSWSPLTSHCNNTMWSWLLIIFIDFKSKRQEEVCLLNSAGVLNFVSIVKTLWLPF